MKRGTGEPGCTPADSPPSRGQLEPDFTPDGTPGVLGAGVGGNAGSVDGIASSGALGGCARAVEACADVGAGR